MPRVVLAVLGAAWLSAAGWAHADEAGRVVFVSGEVRSGARPLNQGDAIQEGEQLLTGRDGYLYMKTIDDGLLILRPNTEARIVSYHVDPEHPANTHVKLELLSGVARSVSGKAVKQARQNFRFNTPVAAIGVRGTDFTVSTNQETSNVTVLSGAIVVSGFGGNCMPGGTGPCEHAASRELAAGQIGQMLQVRRGLTTPQLLNSNSQAPDNVAPPRSDEPVSKPSSASSQPLSSNEPSLDPQKSVQVLQQGLVARNTDVATVPPPTVTAPADPVTVSPSTPAANPLVWGRWAAIAGNAATVDLAAQAKNNNEVMAINSYYAVLRSKDTTWQAPQQGSMGFALRDSDAFVMSDVTKQSTAAKLENGQLNVDFGKATFATSFDLLTGNERFNLQAQGGITKTGGLSGNSQFMAPTNMSVTGALNPDNTAAYIFSSRLDANRVANGVTYWGTR